MQRRNSDGQVLFPMKYIVTTCGISRATLLRLEDEGLLVPDKKEPDSGYRYYSCDNLATIINILKYQHLGFTKREIREIMDDTGKLTAGMEALRRKHLILLRELENMSADLGQKADPKRPENLNIRALPTLGGTFFTKTDEIAFTPENMHLFARKTLEDFISAKIPGNTQQTMKIYVDDADYDRCIGEFDGKKHLVRAIIPTLNPESGPDIITFQPCTMLTLAVKCDYARSEVFFRRVWEQAKNLGMTHAGPVCIAGLPEIFLRGKDPLHNSTLRLMLRTTTPPDKIGF